jgi:hypothetical protein
MNFGAQSLCNITVRTCFFVCHPLMGGQLTSQEPDAAPEELPKFPSGLMKPKSNLRAACCAVTAQQWGHWCCTHNRIQTLGKRIELIGLGAAAGCWRMDL